MLPLKNQTLKQYIAGTFQSIVTSQFVYKTPNHIIQLQRLSFHLHSRKQKKIQYLYLWLLTRQIPYFPKFYPSWKNTSRNTLSNTKTKNNSLMVAVKSKNKFALLHESLMEIISKQISSERQAWRFKRHIVQVLIFSVPLTKSTYLLQMKNTYFPTFSMRLRFCFSNATAFQKVFFLRSLKVLSTRNKILALDSL